MRLAQFTDLHARWHLPGCSRLPSRRSRSMPELFERGLAAAVAAGAEAVAVTGDLLDLPDYLLTGDDYYDYQPATWESEAEADYRLFRGLLEAAGLPFFALPGNHDLPRVMARVFAENEVRDLGGYRVACFWDRDTYGHVPRRFDRERELFGRLLTEEGPPQIHLQHYLITPLLNDGWPYSYFEGDELRRRIVESGRVVLCLAGHRHSGWEPVRDGGCTFSCAPAFGEFPHRWQLIDVDGDRVAVEVRALLDQPLEAGRRVVVLDRDGVISVEPSYHGGPAGVIMLPGADRAVGRLREAGYVQIVISSQSAVGQGYLSRDRVDAGFDALARQLQRRGSACWDAFYYSTGAGRHAVHPDLAPDPHGKPKPDYVLQARELLGFALDGYFIGDSPSDLQAGAAAGLRPILVRTGHGLRTETWLADHPELGAVVVDDLAAAADWILSSDRHIGGVD